MMQTCIIKWTITINVLIHQDGWTITRRTRWIQVWLGCLGCMPRFIHKNKLLRVVSVLPWKVKWEIVNSVILVLRFMCVKYGVCILLGVFIVRFVRLY